MAQDGCLIIVFVVVLLLIGVYCVWRSSTSEKSDAVPSAGANASASTEEYAEYLDGSDGQDEEAFQLIDDPDTIGFGVGPGLFGSGRHWTEGLGN